MLAVPRGHVFTDFHGPHAVNPFGIAVFVIGSPQDYEQQNTAYKGHSPKGLPSLAVCPCSKKDYGWYGSEDRPLKIFAHDCGL